MTRRSTRAPSPVVTPAPENDDDAATHECVPADADADVSTDADVPEDAAVDATVEDDRIERLVLSESDALDSLRATEIRGECRQAMSGLLQGDITLVHTFVASLMAYMAQDAPSGDKGSFIMHVSVRTTHVLSDLFMLGTREAVQLDDPEKSAPPAITGETRDATATMAQLAGDDWSLCAPRDALLVAAGASVAYGGALRALVLGALARRAGSLPTYACAALCALLLACVLTSASRLSVAGAALAGFVGIDGARGSMVSASALLVFAVAARSE